MLLFAIADDVDIRAIEILRKLDGVDVTRNSPQTVVITENETFPVRIEVVNGDEIRKGVRTEVDEPRLLVVNAVLDDDAAAKLEDANVSYIDVAGRRWLRGWRRTTRTHEPRAGRARGLYPASVRIAQLLADHPDEPWTERGLARRGQTTQATAHRLLSRLEQGGLMHREGQGPSTRRRVASASALRRWLSREGRPGRVARLSCFVEDHSWLPASNPFRLALTGAAAAARSGLPVATSAGTPMMRVETLPGELEDVPEALGGFRTEKGANLVLIADPDRLAFLDVPLGIREPFLAPPSRIMLDLFLEPRGEATVDVFLNLWDRRESGQG